MGGLFNTVNLNLYHYAGNNPIKYTDPNGLDYRTGPTGASVKSSSDYYGITGNLTIDSIALTDSSGKIIHTFSNDESIKRYIESINPQEGNLVEVIGAD